MGPTHMHGTQVNTSAATTPVQIAAIKSVSPVASPKTKTMPNPAVTTTKATPTPAVTSLFGSSVKRNTNKGPFSVANSDQFYNACKSGDAATVRRWLKDRSVDINHEFKEHPAAKEFDTPLCAASYANHKEVIDLLIESGADLDKQDSKKEGPLQRASHRGYYELVKHLIECGANFTSLGETLVYAST